MQSKEMTLRNPKEIASVPSSGTTDEIGFIDWFVQANGYLVFRALLATLLLLLGC